MSRDREEFTRKVMMAAWERAGGRCDYFTNFKLSIRCNKKLRPGDINYDHIIPWAISEDSSFGNCQVLCKAHHLLKTTKADVPTIAKVKRVGANHIGAAKPRSSLSNPHIRRTMSGVVVDRLTGQPVGRNRT